MKKQTDKREGVTLTRWNGHSVYRWRVSFPDGVSRRSKGFKVKDGEKGATEFAKKKREEIAETGRNEEAVSPAERRAVMEFRELVKSLPKSISPPSLSDAVKLMGETLGIRYKSKTITELVDNYLITLDRRNLSKSYLYTIKGRLDRLVADYGDWLACDLSREIIGEWLEELKLSAQSVNHFRAAISQLFNHALNAGIVEENPVAKINKKTVKNGEPGILKPSAVADLLHHAPDSIRAALAIGFFAGVRRAELSRMDWSEIDFEQGYIEITASKSKTAARRLIPMRECLRQWLIPHHRHSGPVMPSEMIWRTRLADAMEAAGIASWPHNAPRHSFASYHLAKFQNAAALALEMGHGDTKMIFGHYRALVTPAAGESYWQITPSDTAKITNIKSA